MKIASDIYNHVFMMPQNERIVSRKLEIEGVEYILAGVTEMNKVTSLWILHEQKGYQNAIRHMGRYDPNQTNRELISEGSLKSPRNEFLMIKELSLGDRTFKVGRSSSEVMNSHQGGTYAKLQYFLDKGLPVEMISSMNLFDISISEYQLMDGEFFDMYKAEFDGVITIETPILSRAIPTHKKLMLPFGRYKDPIALEVEIPDNDEVVHCYINGIEAYDLWSDGIEEKLEKNRGIVPEEQYEQWRSNIIEAYERICPRDKNLAVVLYETDITASASFYTTNWLDTVPDDNENGGVGVLFGGGKDQEKGLMGHRLMVAKLQPIPKDFNESIEVELLSLLETLPAKKYVLALANNVKVYTEENYNS